MPLSGRDGEAMSSTYRAGLLVGSHDDAVLARLDLARRWELHDGGRLEAHDPPT